MNSGQNLISGVVCGVWRTLTWSVYSCVLFCDRESCCWCNCEHDFCVKSLLRYSCAKLVYLCKHIFERRQVGFMAGVAFLHLCVPFSFLQWSLACPENHSCVGVLESQIGGFVVFVVLLSFPPRHWHVLCDTWLSAHKAKELMLKHDQEKFVCCKIFFYRKKELSGEHE